MPILHSQKPLSHGPKNAGQIRVEPGFDSVNTFHMRESTLDIKAGRTLLPTLGRIRIKDGGPWRYVARRRSKGPVGSLVGGADTGSTVGSIPERSSVPDDFLHVGATRCPSHGEAVPRQDQVAKEKIQRNRGQAA